VKTSNYSYSSYSEIAKFYFSYFVESQNSDKLQNWWPTLQSATLISCK